MVQAKALWRRLAMLGVAMLGLPQVAGAERLNPGDASAALALVQEVYYEGLPQAAAAKIGPEGASFLIEMLADPESARHHANALEALALSGEPLAYEAIVAYAERPLVGDVDRTTFRNSRAAVGALGHLAGVDPRALDWLAAP